LSIQVRYVGEQKVDVHWHFRSRDLISAWQANVIALTECINREVVWPNNCRLARIIDYSDSLHLYNNMQNVVNEVELVPDISFYH
jgi:thymidylate synthase